MLSAEVQERISSAMTSLSQMERAAFVLRHFEGHSIRRSAGSRAESERGEALDLSRGEENAGGPRAIRADGMTAGETERDGETNHRMPEDDLVLHYYGELASQDGAGSAHIAECHSAMPPIAACSRC
jgi:hypothetical protein